jgi:hypothetical protein
MAILALDTNSSLFIDYPSLIINGVFCPVNVRVYSIPIIPEFAKPEGSSLGMARRLFVQ